jgi:hypothetical protein
LDMTTSLMVGNLHLRLASGSMFVILGTRCVGKIHSRYFTGRTKLFSVPNPTFSVIYLQIYNVQLS